MLSEIGTESSCLRVTALIQHLACLLMWRWPSLIAFMLLKLHKLWYVVELNPS